MRYRMLFLAAAAISFPLLALAQDDASAIKKAFMDAHEKMMREMGKETPRGDPDRDFATFMIPHHQGAVDMAKIELRYGNGPQLRALAEQIVRSQTQEIGELKTWLTNHPAPP